MAKASLFLHSFGEDLRYFRTFALSNNTRYE
jgi:hypothetical protein